MSYTLISLPYCLEKARSNAWCPEVHSGKLSESCIFVILPSTVKGGKSGVDFCEDALAKGVPSILCSKDDFSHLTQMLDVCTQNIEVCIVEDTRKVLGELAAAYYATENTPCKLVGITGTNGKTTSTYLLEELFISAGFKVGVIGTVSYRWPGKSIVAPLTTPGCLEIHRMIAEMQKVGVDYVFMEVSSHALDQERVAGLKFSGALLTNLTQDHLDYHENMEAYFKAKSALFVNSSGALTSKLVSRAINIDDSYGLRLFDKIIDEAGCNIAYGLSENKSIDSAKQLIGRIISSSTAGLKLEVKYKREIWQLNSRLVGSFNAMNLLGVIALSLGLGLDFAKIRALENFNGVCGRLERVENSTGMDVFVDYAHTPDALSKAISALREAGFKRILTVFGCGGDRDKTKRPIMGRAVAEASDVVILTSDNPRTEDPKAIMQDVEPGLADAKMLFKEADRKSAIKIAVSHMHKGDAVLVAGKGHEDYQIIGKEKFHFSDQEVLQEILGKPRS